MQKLFASPLFNVSLLSLFWALQIFSVKLGFLAGAELFTFTIQTMIGMLIILALYVLIQKRHHFKNLSPKILFWLIASSALASGVGGVLSNAGISLTTATNAGFLFQFDIAFTIIIAYFLLKEKMNIPKVLMLALILIGTFLLITNGQLIVPHSGDIFILLAAVCFATTTIVIRKVLKNTIIDPDIVSLFRPLSGLPFLLFVVAFSPLYPATIRQTFIINLLDFHQILYVLLNTIFCVLTIIFVNRSLKIASASYTAMMAGVTPILVAILGIFFLKESLTPIQILGAIFIISASFVTHLLKVDKH